MRTYGPGKETANLAAWQALAVSGNRLHGLHWGSGWEGVGSDRAAGAWEHHRWALRCGVPVVLQRLRRLIFCLL